MQGATCIEETMNNPTEQSGFIILQYAMYYQPAILLWVLNVSDLDHKFM